MINTTRIFGKSAVLVLPETAGQYNAKLITFKAAQEFQFADLSQNNSLVLVNQKKDLFVNDLSDSTTKISLKNKITLPKGISHGYSENNRLYLFDKAGDIYSQTIEALVKEIESSENKEEITRAIVLETSNFCGLTALNLGVVNNKKVVALADQYYKIRLIERQDFHKMMMTTSLRHRYAESLVLIKNKYLLVHYDDSKLQLLGDEEIKDSLNINDSYLEHQFIGKLDFFSVLDTNFLIVFTKDTQEIHLAELNESGLKLSTVDKIALANDGTAEYHLAVKDDTLYLTTIKESDLTPNDALTDSEGDVKELKTEIIKINASDKKLVRQ